MEFEDMKKIWDTQNNQALYVINEKALHNRILSKKRSAGHIAGFSELLLVFVYAGAGLFVLAMALFRSGGSIFMYLMAGWAFSTALYVLVSRVRRMKRKHRFDRSMLGDLDHALSDATYQVRLSGIMRWNTLPMAVFLLFGFWETGKLSVWLTVSLLVFVAFTHFAGGWEHRIYKKRKHELEVLRKKLENGESSDALS